MAQVAYDLNRFAAAPARAQPRPRVRVASRRQSEAKRQFWRMFRTLLAVLFLVTLVSAVLYTQTTMNELQRQMAAANKQLTEEQALYHHLTFELDNMTSLKNVEERAVEMGMEKISAGQINYYRVEMDSDIQVKENPIISLLNGARDGLLDIMGDIVP